MDSFAKEDKTSEERYFWPQGQDTITASHADGGLEEYESELGFSREQLKGKTILDLGSGTTDKFARELHEAGIDARVISLSSDLNTSHSAKTERERVAPNWKISGVSAIAQRLPFKDEAFDMIFGVYSVTYYAHGEHDVKAWVREIRRTLKPGGEARLYPVYDEGSGKDTENIKNAAKKVNLGFSVSTNKGNNGEYCLLTKPVA